jgi:hypothetical protein
LFLTNKAISAKEKAQREDKIQKTMLNKKLSNIANGGNNTSKVKKDKKKNEKMSKKVVSLAGGGTKKEVALTDEAGNEIVDDNADPDGL